MRRAGDSDDADKGKGSRWRGDYDFHVFGFVFAEGEVVTPDSDLQRIAQRRPADELHLRAGEKAHFAQAFDLFAVRVKTSNLGF